MADGVRSSGIFEGKPLRSFPWMEWMNSCARGADATAVRSWAPGLWRVQLTTRSDRSRARGKAAFGFGTSRSGSGGVET